MMKNSFTQRLGIAVSVVGLWCLTACAGQKDAEASLEPVIETVDATPKPEGPVVAGAKWHHIHINSVDPAGSIAFYTKHFDAEAARFEGLVDAVKTQDSWVLFSKVDEPADDAKNTAIWHIGWGAPDPMAEYERQMGLGAHFIQPITDISTGLERIPPGRFYYMYVESPDHTMIELNTAHTDDFGHIHLFSEQPIEAGDWYIRMFGVEGRELSTQDAPSREPSFAKNGIQVGPSSSHYFDQVNMIIYPAQYARTAYAEDFTGNSELQSTRGNVNDHIGVEVPDLDLALSALKAEGVKVLTEKRTIADRISFAFIEGPDRMAIELIEIHGEAE